MNTNTSKERRYFGPSRFQEALAQLAEVQKTQGVEVTTNFDKPEDVPQNHGILFQPVLERAAKRGGPLQLTGMIVAHVPDLSIVQKTDAGTEYLIDALSELYGRRLKQDVAQAQASHAKVKLPQNIEEFVARETRDNLFQNLMQNTVRKLKKNGGSLALLTQAILKNALQSASFAKGMFPKITQADWAKVLDGMIAEADKQGLETSVLTDWRDTRNDKTLEDVESISFE